MSIINCYRTALYLAFDLGKMWESRRVLLVQLVKKHILSILTGTLKNESMQKKW